MSTQPKTPYWQKLQDPRWQKKRLEVLEAAGWKCSCCLAADKRLEVHHPYYISGREPWEYDTANLQCLCYECHEETKVFSKYPFSFEVFAVAENDSGCGFMNTVSAYANKNNLQVGYTLAALEKAMRFHLIEPKQLDEWTQCVETEKAYNEYLIRSQQQNAQ